MMKRNNFSIGTPPRDVRRHVPLSDCENGRAASRIPALGTAIIGSCRSEAIQFEEAGLVDYSPDGVGISLPRPLHSGHCFLLKLTTEPACFAAYYVRHCYCVAAGGDYRIGGELFGTIGLPDAPKLDVMQVLKTLFD